MFMIKEKKDCEDSPYVCDTTWFQSLTQFLKSRSLDQALHISL